MRVVGAPVGTDAFVNEFLEAKMSDYTIVLPKMKKLRRTCALPLLRTTYLPIPTHLSRVVRPHLMRPFAAQHDTHIINTYKTIMDDDHTVSPHRHPHSQRLSSLTAWAFVRSKLHRCHGSSCEADQVCGRGHDRRNSSPTQYPPPPPPIPLPIHNPSHHLKKLFIITQLVKWALRSVSHAHGSMLISSCPFCQHT
jgi:hypothetical protein